MLAGLTGNSCIAASCGVVRVLGILELVEVLVPVPDGPNDEEVEHAEREEGQQRVRAEREPRVHLVEQVGSADRGAVGRLRDQSERFGAMGVRQTLQEGLT